MSYPDLNLDQLKNVAFYWANRYPNIKTINLYRGIPPRYDYVVEAVSTKIHRLKFDLRHFRLSGDHF